MPVCRAELRTVTATMSRMDDWAVWTLTGTAPFAVAGLAALLTPLILPVRTLRRDLSIDAGMLDRLPAGAVQTELSQDVEARATRLLAWTRYPTLTRSEMFTFVLSLVILAGTFLTVASALTGEPGEVLGAWLAFLSAVLSLALWTLASWSWGERAGERLGYLRERGATIDAARGRVRVAGYLLWAGAGLIVVVQVGAAYNVGLALWDSTGLAVLAAALWALILVGAGASMTAKTLEVATEA